MSTDNCPETGFEAISVYLSDHTDRGIRGHQLREDHCVIVDLVGKGKHIRTVPVPSWAKQSVDEWTAAAAITEGAIFRRVSRLDKIWGDGITPKAIWHVVRVAAKRAEIKNLAPHDLRRTCARLCHLAGGELEQIQFLLGHASVQTHRALSRLQAKTQPSSEQQTRAGRQKTVDRVVIAPKPTCGPK